MTYSQTGAAIIVLDSVDSTNDEAWRRVEGGETGPIWIASREQTSGRGRHGRHWQTRPGNLAATLLLPFEGSPAEAARLSFVAALAVADVLDALAAPAPVTLKWPNDVLLDGAKVAGILLENFGPGPDGRLAIAVGIGVNLAHHPDPTETGRPATSIRAHAGSAPDFDAALALLARRLGHWLRVSRADGFGRIRTAWLARAARLGEQIEVRLPRVTLSGRFADLDADGALVLEVAEGPRRIAAGDVYFPGAS